MIADARGHITDLVDHFVDFDLPMTKLMTVSTAKKLVSEGAKARTRAAQGLYLDVRGPERAQWVCRYTFQGKAREAGLGGFQTVSLPDARERVEDIQKVLRRGLDPLEVKATVERADAAAAAKKVEVTASARRTFKMVADEMLATYEAGWSNAKHRQQWANTLEAYAYAHFGSVAVGEVTTEHVLAALGPIWSTKPETASRLRGRIERVLDFAKARKWRSGENPAAWRGHLKALLPTPSKIKRVKHRPALPWLILPSFMKTLRAADGVGAAALELAILTAARSGEVRGMTWGEVDVEHGLWTIPADRMKARREHRVPLSAAALAVLERMRPWRKHDGRDALVFNGASVGRPLSDMSLLAVLRRMTDADGHALWTDAAGHPVVPHGFRSTFRDWCAERRKEPREVAEAALAHTLGDETEAAYARSDMLERRESLMTAWADYCAEERGTIRQLAG
jgi:integrase